MGGRPRRCSEGMRALLNVVSADDCWRWAPLCGRWQSAKAGRLTGIVGRAACMCPGHSPPAHLCSRIVAKDAIVVHRDQHLPWLRSGADPADGPGGVPADASGDVFFVVRHRSLQSSMHAFA